MRAIWKGAISFGLVNIPVGLYSATVAASEIKLRMLRGKDLSPIRYKRVAEADEKEVPWEEIVKGYEFEKDAYVVVTKEDLERVNVKSNQTVDIKEFVKLEEIDPMFFDEPYYLAPEKAGEKAYTILHRALVDSGKVGIAKVVIKTREHLAAVKPKDGVLMLELMHFPDELASADELMIKKADVGKKEQEMAKSLVDSMTGDWDPAQYKDEYRQALMEVIDEKVAAGAKEVSHKKAPAARKATNVVDLVDVLRKSLEESGKAGGKKKKAKTPARRKSAA
jgi:DNA end-binding protein Ku